jgi:putative ubiquitin-RnfH superfamily antitoxin RatB of RatAB toxin-antitoxin module
MAAELLKIEVVYADALQQSVIQLSAQLNTTVAEAIYASGILNQFPDIDLAQQKVGIFSQLCGLDTILNNGDRVEIYRPLLQDPMEARRGRLRK